MTGQDRYSLRGVSSQKEEVHKAVSQLDQGLFPKAFCKIYPDYWANDPDFVNIMHADGAGTKSILAYLYWKETGDISVWKGIAIDAIVMNIDDLLCVGATGPFTYSSTIGRNKLVIPGAVISEIINGSQSFFDTMKGYGIDIYFMGGETADIGDLARTIIVDGTMACRMPKANIVHTDNIQPGQVIVSFASYGQAAYEDAYNSGIGSNGLTSARHEILKHDYFKKYPESADPNLPESVIYNGKYSLKEKSPYPGLDIGKMLLSPTRTYAPLILKILEKYRQKVSGIIHCSGGGQTKCLHYLPQGLKVIKDNLLPAPPLFRMIQEAAETPWKEMYRVFNMGQRLEIFTDLASAEKMILVAEELGIEVQISGRVEAAEQNSLIIEGEFGTFSYS